MGVSVSGWGEPASAPAQRGGSGCRCWWPTGCGATARRQLLAFLRTRGESQADWEALLQDLYRRGLEGKNLLLIVTDGCAGLAAAIQTVYPRVPHQRCWVHKMRNILEKVRKRDYDAVKADAQAIYRADSRAQAQAAARAFCRRWRAALSPHGAATGARSAGVAGVFPLAPSSVEESCAPPTSLSAVSWKCAAVPGPWSAL